MLIIKEWIPQLQQAKIRYNTKKKYPNFHRIEIPDWAGFVIATLCHEFNYGINIVALRMIQDLEQAVAKCLLFYKKKGRREQIEAAYQLGGYEGVKQLLVQVLPELAKPTR